MDEFGAWLAIQADAGSDVSLLPLNDVAQQYRVTEDLANIRVEREGG